MNLIGATAVKLAPLYSPIATALLLISQGKLILGWTKSELISLSTDQAALEVLPTLKLVYNIGRCLPLLPKTGSKLKGKHTMQGFFGLLVG